MADPIQGLVRDEVTGAPGRGFVVAARDTRGALGDELGDARTDDEGVFEIPLREEMAERLLGGELRVFFVVSKGGRAIGDTRETVLWDPREPRRVKIVLPLPAETAERGLQVSGLVVTDRGSPVVGIEVEASDRLVRGGNVLGTDLTDSGGRYEIRYVLEQLGRKQAADLEVAVMGIDAAGGRVELARSPVVYQARPSEVVDLQVTSDSQVRASEHERLLTSLDPLLDGIPLSEVEPDGVTYLANRAGWDPRMIAMAVQAERASTETGMPASHYYALFRSGVATDANSVHRLPDEALARGIEAAEGSALIAGGEPMQETLEVHRRQARTALSSFVPSGGVSTVDEMLSIRLDDAQKAIVVDRLRETQGEPGAFWDSLIDADIDPVVVGRLRLDGKLGALTRHNAPVMLRLVAEHSIGSTTDLVSAGLYEPAPWEALIGDNVPEGLTREQYAAGLAAQVEEAHPTLVTADLVRKEAIDLGPAAVATSTADFLKNHASDHQIGETPIRSWPGFAELEPDVGHAALRVERLHQLSPSNGSMRALAATGIDSARAAAQYSERDFLASHGGAFPSMEEAALVHRKAQQVHGMVLNLATTYLTGRQLPPMRVLQGDASDAAIAAGGGGVVNAAPPPAKARLDELFGNLDFCACEQCRSVLSPAAYLVELLEFLDLSDIAHERSNPIDVLLARRPDLQHILLNCENTNVAVSYLDLVNEVLEHYVINGDLTAFEGYDTPPDAVSADLLVDPQVIQAGAYAALAEAVFPSPLPFDMPLEALRLLFQTWGTTLADFLVEVRRPGDAAAAADARRERLRLNPSEQSILTDSGFHPLPEYLGEPAAATIDELNAAVSNAKVLCRRLEVSYLDFDRILRSKLVNPGIDIAETFVALSIGLDEVQKWFNGTITEAELLDQLPDDLDPAPFDDDVPGWLTTTRAALMSLVVLKPTADADPDLDDCDFRALEVRLSVTDPADDALTELEYHRLVRFVRLWRALQRRIDADLDMIDRLVALFLPIAPSAVTLANLDETFNTLLARIANLVHLFDELKVTKKKRKLWLELFDTTLDRPSRRERLSRLVKLGTTDLDDLITITGVEPLADDLETDEPSLLRFVRLAKTVTESPLKVDDVNFVLRGVDVSGTRIPTDAQRQADLRTLRAALAAVDVTLGAGVSDLGAAEARMALVYEPAVVAQFFGLLARTTTYSVPFTTVEVDLPSPVTDISGALGFDGFAKMLTFTGTMTLGIRDALTQKADDLVSGDVDVIDDPAELDAYVADLKAAITALHAAAAADDDDLRTEHPELGTVLDDAVAETDPAAQAPIVVKGILPELASRLKATAARTTLAGLLGVDETVTAALTFGPNVMEATSDPTKGVLTDLLAIDEAVAFDQDNTFTLLVDPPAAGDYLFYVRAPEGTDVGLDVDGITVVAGMVGPSGEVASANADALAAGTTSTLELTVTNLPAGEVAELWWRTRAIPKERVPSARLIDGDAADTADRSLLRLRKAAMLASALGLTAREVRYFASACPDTQGILDDLPIDGPPADPTDVPPAWAKLEPLLWFARWKRDTEPDADTWVDVLDVSALGDAEGQARVATIGSWRPDDVTEAVSHLAATGTGLQRLTTLRAVQRIASLAVDTDQTVEHLVDWSVADPDPARVDTVRASVKAALDVEAWRTTTQSVNDELRNLRRDALVAYILAHDPPTPTIETADELYEHFLVDVQMDACLQTSRIRLALSTVQLFITRCLMSLEDEVSPASIRQDRWAWMKRYRVWEANRKVFLWPENWLEPELRDSKSPFFRELESDLLKSDITTDLAEEAFISYLKKLDDVARLEIVGCYLQEGIPGKTDDDILHVVARTNGKTRQYWYRRFEYGYWTPWEKIALNIEGDLVIPTMWRNQLYLFWVTEVRKPQRGDQDQDSTKFADQKWRARSRIDVELTLNWGELYRGKWLAPKSTNMRKPLVLRNLVEFDPGSVLLFTHTEKPPGLSERLIFSVLYYRGSDLKAYKVVFTSKNAPPVVTEDDGDNELLGKVAMFDFKLFWARQTDSTLDSNSLDVHHADVSVRVDQPEGSSVTTKDETILTKQSGRPGWNVRPVLHPVENQWQAPFFYTDEHSVFHVQPVERTSTFDYVDWYVPVSIIHDGFKIPDLHEQVVIPNPLDEVWNPEWREVVNPRVVNVLDDTLAFELDGVKIDALGLRR